jgi:hypothetical protein
VLEVVRVVYNGWPDRAPTMFRGQTTISIACQTARGQISRKQSGKRVKLDGPLPHECDSPVQITSRPRLAMVGRPLRAMAIFSSVVRMSTARLIPAAPATANAYT